MTVPPSPPPVSSVGDQLEGFHRMRWITIVAVGVALAGALIVLAVMNIGQRNQIEKQDKQIVAQQFQIIQQEREIHASCGFYRPLAGLPPMPAPGSSKPSRIGVQIIVGSRDSYTGQHCRPPLGPPSTALIRGEQLYNIH